MVDTNSSINDSATSGTKDLKESMTQISDTTDTLDSADQWYKDTLEKMQGWRLQAYKRKRNGVILHASKIDEWTPRLFQFAHWGIIVWMTCVSIPFYYGHDMMWFLIIEAFSIYAFVQVLINWLFICFTTSTYVPEDGSKNSQPLSSSDTASAPSSSSLSLISSSSNPIEGSKDKENDSDVDTQNSVLYQEAKDQCKSNGEMQDTNNENSTSSESIKDVIIHRKIEDLSKHNPEQEQQQQQKQQQQEEDQQQSKSEPVSGSRIMMATKVVDDKIIRESVPYWSWNYCISCERKRPPRCHHCTLCKQCVLKRDHHCYFSRNCVGLYNQRYFVYFLFWCVIYTNWGCYQLLPYIFNEAIFNHYSYINLIIPVNMFFAIFGEFPIRYCHLVIMLWCGLGLWLLCMVMFGGVCILVFLGKTKFEYDSGIKVVDARSIPDRIRSVMGRNWAVGLFIPGGASFHFVRSLLPDSIKPTQPVEDAINWPAISIKT